MTRMVRIVLVIAVVAVLALPMAAQQANQQSASNPLVQLLESKGILSADEAATVRTASNSAEANERLARLLWSKGLISQEEYNNTVAAAALSAANTGSSGAHMVNAAAPVAPAAGAISPSPEPKAKTAEWPVTAMNIGYDPSDGASADASTIPAIAPVRVLPITLPRDPKGIIPDIKLGSGAMISLYGFLKASAVYDTTNSGGNTFGSNDFPLPLLLGDTGPNSGDQFRIKARATRAGVNFFYPIAGPNIILTGKMEMDWEGDYTTVNNRNISSIRSSQLSLRLAFARIDAKWGDTDVFAELGQDWTLLGSSTMMDIFESTGNGVGFGQFYERLPQFKVGSQFKAGKLKIQPEFAITLSAFGDSGINTSANGALLGDVSAIPTGFQTQSREGAILGQASGQPGLQGRLVLDFPLNSGWKGVPNAEVIVSGGHAEAEYIVPFGNIPTTGVYNTTTGAAILTTPTDANTINPNLGVTCSGATPATGFSVRCYYPKGVSLNVPQNAFSAEIQLPTPWFTVVSKYYRGGDLRFYFAGQLNTAFRDSFVGPDGTNVAPFTIPGSTNLVTCSTSATCSTSLNATGTNIGQVVYALSGDPVSFSAVNGSAVVNPYRPIRGQGGVVQIGIPLSRLFGANPEGLNSGWTFFAGYGVDSAFARDVIRAGGNSLLRSDYVPVSLRYRINKWATVVNEITWYDTRTADPVLVAPFTRTVPVSAIPAHINHDIREEFGTIFTF